MGQGRITMGCPPTREEQSQMDREAEARIKRADETGGVHCDPSAAPTRAEVRRAEVRRAIPYQSLSYQEITSGSLKGLWRDYSEEVYDIVATTLEQCVVPFCDERGMSFSVGMGTWCIKRPGERPWEPDDHKDDEKWQELVAVLTTFVTGFDQELGHLMPDYQPEKMK